MGTGTSNSPLGRDRNLGGRRILDLAEGILIGSRRYSTEAAFEELAAMGAGTACLSGPSPKRWWRSRPGMATWPNPSKGPRWLPNSTGKTYSPETFSPSQLGAWGHRKPSRSAG